MIITSNYRIIIRFFLNDFFVSSTYAPRCAKCAYPICPEEVRQGIMKKSKSIQSVL
jgi:hypothetical protein